MRDFFYNKGDVLIAILIIIAAAVVIYFRVGVVMGDSDPGERLRNLVSPIAAFITGERGGNQAGDGEEAQAAESPAPATTEPTETEPPAVTAAPPEEDLQEPKTEDPVAAAGETAEPPAPAPQTSDMKITVNAGDAASTIADKLLAAGAITDKQAFISEVIAQKADSKLKQGTFTIPAGSSVNDIIKILVG